jgi:hypothetical protein
MLARSGEAWVDNTGAKSIANVAADARIPWHATDQSTNYRLDKGRVLWVRFTVPPTPHPGALVPSRSLIPASTGSPCNVQNAAGEWTERSAGDSVPVANWPLPHRHPIVPLGVSPQTPQVHYVRVQNGTIFGAHHAVRQRPARDAQASSASRSPWASISAWWRWR